MTKGKLLRMLRGLGLDYRGRTFRLIAAAIALHVLLTVFVFLSGRYGLFPRVFDPNGVAVASDGYVYHSQAVALLELLDRQGAGAWLQSPTPFHVKLYSLSFALFQSFWGFTILSAEPLNLLLYLSIVGLVLKLGKEAFDASVGLYAALAVAVWPSLLLHTTQLLKDPFFIAAMLALVLVLTVWLKRAQSVREGLLSGAAGGAAATVLWLIRSEMWEVIVTILFLGVGMLLLRNVYERRILKGNLVSACVLLLVALSVPRFMAAYQPFGAYRATDTTGSGVATAGDKCSENAVAVQSFNTVNAATVGEERLWSRVWQKVDGAAARTGRIRCRFITFYPSAGSNIDTGVRFNNLEGFARYVPRALSIGLLAPFPNMWFVTKTRVGLAGRLLSGLETLLMYACEMCAAYGLWRRRKYLPAWLLASIVVLSVTALSMVVVNVGTLYRMRYAFWILLIILGVEGWSELRRAMRARKGSRLDGAEADGVATQV